MPGVRKHRGCRSSRRPWQAASVFWCLTTIHPAGSAWRSLLALLGSAVRVRVLELPRETKDITDWFNAGHSECELIAMLEGLDVSV